MFKKLLKVDLQTVIFTEKLKILKYQFLLSYFTIINVLVVKSVYVHEFSKILMNEDLKNYNPIK